MGWSDPNDEFKFVTAAAPVEGAKKINVYGRDITELRRADVGAELEKLHTFKATVRHLAANPATGEWAAIVGYGVSAYIVTGGADDEKLLPGAEIRTGRSPEVLAFSGDGKTLVALNGDGTVSVLSP